MLSKDYSLKVLFIAHVPGMSGANRSLVQLVKELRDVYHVEPVVLVPETEPETGTINEALKQLGIPIITTNIWFFKLEAPTLRNVFGYVRYLWRHRHLYKQLQSYHFDLIHSNCSVVDLGAYLSRLLHIKHVWHLREFGDKDYALKPIGGKWYEKFTYRHADAFIAISKAVAQHYLEKIPEEKIHTIYNGVFISDDTPIAQHQNPTVQFFCAGIVSEVKNQKEIILAVDELVHVRKVRKAFHLTLVGLQTQPYTNELKQLVVDRGLNDYVTLLPEADGIQTLAAQMDVGIMSSRAEAFGRVTIEYQMQNLLVIANDAGANRELIEDNRTGLLYQAGDYRSLADKMSWSMEHYPVIDTISSEGRLYALQHFLSSTNTRQVYELYQKLLQQQ